jgi:hypothetical protein
LNIHNLPVQKGYQIKNVYYTDSEENIVKKKLKELLESDNPFLTRYQRNINNNRVNQEFPLTTY